jgi:hypothetical protein
VPAQSHCQNQCLWFESWYCQVQTGLHLPRPRTPLSGLVNRVTNRFVRGRGAVLKKWNGFFACVTRSGPSACPARWPLQACPGLPSTRTRWSSSSVAELHQRASTLYGKATIWDIVSFLPPLSGFFLRTYRNFSKERLTHTTCVCISVCVA